jgi:hypothetical protein
MLFTWVSHLGQPLGGDATRQRDAAAETELRWPRRRSKRLWPSREIWAAWSEEDAPD